MQWWEDEQFWRDLMPYLFGPAAMDYEEDLEDILDRSTLPDGGRILDVGCGVGRLAIPLARQGYEVVGIDLCDAFRRRLRTLAAEQDLDIDVRARSAFEMNLGDTEPFDLVLDVFAALGYCEDPVEDIRAVTGFFEALKPGGQVFIATRHPQSSNGRFKHTSANGYCIEERRFERTTGHAVTQWTVTGPRNRVHHSIVRLYEAKDLHGLLSVCGFRDIQLSEQPGAERIIAIGTVPVPPTSD